MTLERPSVQLREKLDAEDQQRLAKEDATHTEDDHRRMRMKGYRHDRPEQDRGSGYGSSANQEPPGSARVWSLHLPLELAHRPPAGPRARALTDARQP